MSFLCSLIIGGNGPLYGMMIMKCLVGIGTAKFEERNGLEEIYPWLIIMFVGAFAQLFAKTA